MGDALGLSMDPTEGGGATHAADASESSAVGERAPFFDFSEDRIAESRERQRLKSGEGGKRSSGSPKKRVSFTQ